MEEREGKLFGYEFKWSEKKKKNNKSTWMQVYPEASFEVIDRENYLDFLL